MKMTQITLTLVLGSIMTLVSGVLPPPAPLPLSEVMKTKTRKTPPPAPPIGHTSESTLLYYIIDKDGQKAVCAGRKLKDNSKSDGTYQVEDDGGNFQVRDVHAYLVYTSSEEAQKRCTKMNKTIREEQQAAAKKKIYDEHQAWSKRHREEHLTPYDRALPQVYYIIDRAGKKSISHGWVLGASDSDNKLLVKNHGGVTREVSVIYECDDEGLDKARAECKKMNQAIAEKNQAIADKAIEKFADEYKLKASDPIWFIHNPLADVHSPAFRIREGTFIKQNEDGKTCRVRFTSTLNQVTKDNDVYIEYNHIARKDAEGKQKLQKRIYQAKRTL